MALNPGIALQGNNEQPNLGQSIQNAGRLMDLRYQPQRTEAEIANLKASTASTEAQTPGIAADSAIKERALAFKNWQSANSPSFVTTGEDGKPQLDKEGFVTAASQAGFVTEAQQVAAADLANSKAVLDLKQGNVTVAKDIDAFGNKVRTYNASLLAGLPPEQREAAHKKHQQLIETLLPGSAKLMGDYNPNAIEPIKTASMTPLENANLKLSERGTTVSERNVGIAEREQVAAFEEKYNDADGKSPTSKISKAVQQAYLAANPEGVDEKTIKGMSAYDIATRFPDARGVIARADVGARVDAPTRLTAAATASAYAGAQVTINRGVSAARELMTGVPTAPGQKVSDFLRTFVATDGRRQLLETAIQEHNAQNPGAKIDPASLQMSALVTQLSDSSRQLTSKIKRNEAVSSNDKLSPGKSPADAGKVMVEKNGERGMIPRGRLEAYLGQGYKEVK